MQTNGFSIKPLRVKLLAGEQKAAEVGGHKSPCMDMMPAKATHARTRGGVRWRKKKNKIVVEFPDPTGRDLCWTGRAGSWASKFLCFDVAQTNGEDGCQLVTTSNTYW